jgi:HAD superfamily hydrolase (TIGR01490 family)
MAACYFDVDGTLVKTNLVHPTAYYMINQPSPLGSLRKLGRAVLSAPRLAMAELQDRRLFNELLFNIYEGVSEDRLLMLAPEVVEEVLRPALFKGARELIAQCKKAGHEVVLVSGALDVHMRLLAKEIGADDVIANVLEIKDGYATGKLMRPVVAGPEKAVLIRDHARRRGHKLEDCFAYSDSYSDVPMLSVVGHPAAVNPDSSLERLARVYSWPILHLDRAA